jgi:hypothetical protein
LHNAPSPPLTCVAEQLPSCGTFKAAAGQGQQGKGASSSNALLQLLQQHGSLKRGVAAAAGAAAAAVAEGGAWHCLNQLQCEALSGGLGCLRRQQYNAMSSTNLLAMHTMAAANPALACMIPQAI